MRSKKFWADKLTSNPTPLLLTIFALLVGGFWSAVSIKKHLAFETSNFDLGIFTNALWNLTHGFGYISAPKGGINLLRDHQSFSFLLLAPLFWLFPKPETLLMIQGVGLALGAIPLYYIGKQYLGKQSFLAFLLPLVYWNYFPIRNANAFEFHPEVLMLPSFLATIACFQSESKKKRWIGIIFLILSLGMKESAGPVACGIGLGWILGAGPKATRKFTTKFGLGVCLAGLLTFIFDVVLFPKLLHFDYAYFDSYGNSKSSISEIFLSALRHPFLFFEHILDRPRRQFLYGLLKPLGFLPVLNWPAAVASLPGLFMLFMTEGVHRITFIFHYAIEPSVGIFWALPGGILKFSNFSILRKSYQWFVPIWIILWIILGHKVSEIHRYLSYHVTDHVKWVKAEVIPCIDPDVSIAATDPWGPHLVNRHWIEPLNDLTNPHPHFVSCIIIDQTMTDNMLIFEGKNINQIDTKKLGFQEVYRCGKVSVFEKSQNCFRCLPRCHENS